MSIQAAVAYCGGCNPEIDRARLIRSLVRKTGLVIHPAAQVGPEVELLIVVNGCVRGCLRKPTTPKYQELIVIAGLSADGWPVAREEIEDILVRKVTEVAALAKRL